MTNPKCRDCGSVDVVWGTGKNGRPVLYDTKRLHWIGCKKRPKKDAGPACAAAVVALSGKPPNGLGYKVREAKEMVGEVPADVIARSEVAEIVTWALKRKGET